MLSSASQQSQSLDKETVLSSLPPEWPADLTATIAARVASDDQTVVVVLDDDPTGTQTVHDVPVLTDWSAAAIESEFDRGTPAFYVLTNSRSLGAEDAAALNDVIARRLKIAANERGRRLSVISRSDSTLRGHYPLEIDVLAEALRDDDDEGGFESPVDGQVVVPFFLEGGRLTIDDVHYVAEGTRLVPAAETPFARDAVFGFTKSNLTEYVEEKTGGRFKRDAVESITIDDVRRGGPDVVREKLARLTDMRPCVVNAVTLRDVQVFAMGLLDAEEKDGKRILVRSAASFVQARIGLPKKPVLSASAINSGDGANGGLIVVGSYVPKTTKQLESLLTLDGLEKIEIDVAELVGDDAEERARALDGMMDRVRSAVASGKDTVVYTSRKLVTGSTPAESLAIGNAVSRGLVSIVSDLDVQPRFVIAKGGITSSDVATKGLGIRRAMVLGQASPGVPVWSVGRDGKFPGMSYVVFPGNVGGDDALRDLVRRLSSE
eukprot:CAMPEP_0172545622 /NCGR_PEP_ID=MMETSP1067-20121228/15509_1 /TAXON_ID=265564 ORGANISM="Thalassiosira punctigera, Strain Tpunct2005C2" /NCGR_SAMPLE_ID=MMETSP1067 /ASSEMBLY_ACC=CAM_ASM_000444 /LENGTH=491 /DNA_ID=CAMNT_0013332401 /DNA_START=28 /DNA_END=1503 /DNA_ORIENTATION=+